MKHQNLKKIQLAFIILLPTSVCAEVTLDGSTGPNYSLASTNGTYQITESLGTQQGSNLFHSFSRFNLNSQETAVFSGSSQISNIITRVTGDQMSVIDGKLQSDISGANLWFINPNGVLFGENATIDIGGSFYASTADYLGFADNTNLYSDLEGEQSFSTAEPKSFGFLDNQQAAIIVNGSQISLQAGQTFALAGGNTTILNARIDADTIQITANEMNTNLAISNVPSMDFDVKDFSDVNINNSVLLSSGQQAQGIYILAGKLVVEDSHLEHQSAVSNFKDVNIGNVEIHTETAFLYDSTVAVFTDNEKISHIKINASDKIDLSGSDIYVESDIVQANILISADEKLDLSQDSAIFAASINDYSHDYGSNITLNGLLDIEPNVESEFFQSENSLSINNQQQSVKLTKSEASVSSQGMGVDASSSLTTNFNVSLSSRPCSIASDAEKSYFQSHSDNAYVLMPSDFNPGSAYATADILSLNRKRISELPSGKIGLYRQCG